MSSGADPTTGVTFTGLALDRATDRRRDREWLAALVSEPASRAVAASADGVLLADDPPALARVAVAGLVQLTSAQPDPILLGLEGSRALFAVDLERLGRAGRDDVAQGRRLAPLREAGAVLSHSEAGLAAYTTALLNWHRRHPHCSVCGAMTAVAEGGYSRRCPVCGAVHFPRTDPAVIVLVNRAGRVLLGRRPGWPERQYSILAGFVSPGESLEEAVVREVFEESGIEVRQPLFVTSQPWPFPSSLMLGFKAQAGPAAAEPTPRDGELEDVAWFTRDEVGAALAGEEEARLKLPPGVSIARFLIERWWCQDL